MAKGDLLGDPRKVAEELANRESQKTEKVLEEAKQHAYKIIEDAYKKALSEGEKRLREEFSKAEEQLKSIVSSLELDLKTIVSSEKSKYVEEVIKEALEKIDELAEEEWYEKYLESILLKLTNENYDRLILKTNKRDKDTVQAIIAKLGLRGLEVSPEPVDILGGVIAEAPDGSVRLDYSLDLLVRMNEYKLMSVASRKLFVE